MTWLLVIFLQWTPPADFCPARDCPFYVRDEKDWARLVRALATSGPGRLPGVNRLRHHDFDCDCDVDLEDAAAFQNQFHRDPVTKQDGGAVVAARRQSDE